MAEIDIDKLICSLLADHPEGIQTRNDLHRALRDQGLEYKDGAITKSTELEESEDEKMKRVLAEGFAILSKDEEWYDGVTVGQILAWFEKQGEKEPTGKVEPKFHEGEWVQIDRGHAMKILEVEEEIPCYKILNHYGGESIRKISDIDSIAHSWTIQDAKNGDVLSFNDGHGNDCIELIKSITGKKIEFWFCLTNGNRYEVFDGITPYTNLISREDATPATKEQRDLLFQKMQEAGYEWDAEKKELKKIEQEPVVIIPRSRVGDVIRPKGSTAEYTIESISGECYHGKGWGLHIGYEDDYELVEHNPAEWTEEDIQMYRNTLCYLSEPSPLKEVNGKSRKQLLDWFKALKDRVQLQPQWKPSDEQMDALLKLEEMHVLEHEKNQENAHLYMVVKSLREHLLKLREE